MSNPFATLRYASVLLVVLTLAGCISMPGANKKKIPPSIYTLHSLPPGNQQTSVPTRSAVVVIVPRPELPVGFDTERIALLLEQGHRLDYYAGATWSGRLDELLQDFMVQMTQRVLPDRVSATTSSAAAARYKLTVKFTDFQPVYQASADTPPRLDVAMTITLLALPGETVKAQFRLKNSAPASANTMSIITKELESLLQSLTEEALQKIAPSL